MEHFFVDFVAFLLRWLHVITGIAWIGASFFFMHLDASLRATPELPPGKGGVAWQVHGGGFYEMRKYFVAPETLPHEITWHKWQSYSTWISGFVLLCWIYYAQASLYLIDPAIMALSTWQASAIGLVSLALGWVVYDQLCKSPLGKSNLVLGIVGFGFVIATSWFYTLVFSGRGAMIHTGALMATAMTANVFFVIMPNQRKVIAALTRGDRPDPALGIEAKQRSAHNNYITLPVLFTMLSNHTPMFWANSAVIPLIVALMVVAGAIIRHFFNVRNADHAKSPWWAWLVAALALAAAFAVAMASAPGGREVLGLAPREIPNLVATGHRLPSEQVAQIMIGRCSMCHAAEPVWEGIAIAPKGVMLDTPERMAQQAGAIRLWTVLTHAMPPNNLTGITEAERKSLAAWLKSPKSIP